MSDALVIPEPSALSVANAPALCAAVVAWADQTDDLDAVDDARRKMAAIEEYLAGTEASGPAMSATRLLEARVGALLGEPVNTGVASPNPLSANSGSNRQLRHEFRLMAANRARWEPTLPASRASVLRSCRRDLMEAAKDRDARKIVPGGTDADGPGWQILAGDFRDRLSEMPPGSVDMILTDPPYPEEFAMLWSDMAEHAARILRPGGIAAVMSGKIALDDRMARLGRHLKYGWVYAQLLPGSNTRVLGRHAIQEWKPWICYSNGPWPSGRIDWHGDLLVAGPRTKDAYHWQQQLDPAVEMVLRLSRQDDLILDPFCGTGTYGMAAVMSGRRFVGIEVDAGRVEIATQRLRDAAAA